MTLGFWLSYATLSLVQGLLVLVPVPKGRLQGSRMLGLLLPAGLLLAGVLLVRDLSHGAQALTDLATFGTPLAAALAGVLLGWRRRPWVIPTVAASLYLVAWQTDGLVADAAGLVLIAGACVSGAALLGRVAGRRELTIGLLLLVCLDVVLVFGTSQVQQTTTTLHAIVPPSGGGRPLPALQDVTLGPSMMGWLDLLAPLLLGLILAGSPRRPRAAIVVTVAGLAWGCLLYVTPMIPATVPVLIGLATVALVAERVPLRNRRRSDRRARLRPSLS